MYVLDHALNWNRAATNIMDGLWDDGNNKFNYTKVSGGYNSSTAPPILAGFFVAFGYYFSRSYPTPVDKVALQKNLRKVEKSLEEFNEVDGVKPSHMNWLIMIIRCNASQYWTAFEGTPYLLLFNDCPSDAPMLFKSLTSVLHAELRNEFTSKIYG